LTESNRASCIDLVEFAGKAPGPLPRPLLAAGRSALSWLL
jgi:hypothetical protein